MSKRIPPTSADRAIADLLTRLPALESMPDITISTMDELTLTIVGVTSGAIKNSEIALWSRWRNCRQVYRFDATLSRELTNTDAPDSMPIAVLRQLPYPVVYVEAPVHIIDVISGDEIDCKGFFVFVDSVMDANDSVVDGVTLVFYAPQRQHKLSPVNLSLSIDTLGAAVDDLVQSDISYYPNYAPEYHDKARRAIVAAINHLLYVIDAQSDQRIMHRPSAVVKSKRAARTTNSTIHEVGAIVGKSLRAEKVVYDIGSASDMPTKRKSPRAHMRAGHWRHYWIGPRNDPEKRSLVVRWIAPVLVGSGAVQTIVHDT